MTTTTTPGDDLRERARRLGLWGLLVEWDRLAAQPWVAELLAIEETERRRRGLERRIRDSHLGRFKPLADFDFTWPKKIDREQVEDLLSLSFLEQSANVILVGPNGVGKTMIAKNLVHHAVLSGSSALLLTASELLNDLAAQESASSLQRRLRHYCRPKLLAIDELGYLSYNARHADLLFEVVSRRYGHKSILVTTNKPFAEWNQAFPNAFCVVTLVDRLVHHAEIVQIEGESYRFKEATEEAARKAKDRALRRRRRTSPPPATTSSGSGNGARP